MIVECKVILNNEAVTVIRYGDKNVQIPAIGRKVKVIKVKDDGKYTVVPDDYVDAVLEDNHIDVEKPAEKKTRAKRKKAIEVEEVTFLEG